VKPYVPDVTHPLDVIVFDFDGILAEGTWPSPRIGNPIPAGVELLKEYARLGYAITINTARPASHERALRFWLEVSALSQYVYDIRFDKPLGCLYIDDRAWNPTKEEGWDAAN
jgi:hypothetical protein